MMIFEILQASWSLLLESSPYILFGLLVGGLLKVFLSTDYVAKHLGQGKISSVLKASLLGIPIPLCSCGVLPAAASLKKQGANNGATTAFLISTPESGVDSISISWALLDPILTIARPVSAFISAFFAGVLENILEKPKEISTLTTLPLASTESNSCDCSDCETEPQAQKNSWFKKVKQGIEYAAIDIWGDLVGWFAVGILIAGAVTALIPDEMIAQYLGGGLSSMLLMLVIGIPLYICATASTPIAAAFILKGVSPGTALVFLLVGPATNMTSLSVLTGILGKRATGIYLTSIAVISVICGLVVDFIYLSAGITATAVLGQAGAIIPEWIALSSTILLAGLSIQPLYQTLKNKFSKQDQGCGCNDGSCSTPMPLNHSDPHQH